MIEPPRHPDFRLLPHRIDWMSRHAPYKVYAKFPRCPHNVAAGFETMTYHDLATAINRAAWWLQENLQAHKVFAYWGPSDLRWSMLLVAGIKTGKIMIHASPWARLDGLLAMLDKLNCTVLVYDDESLSDAVAESPFAQLSTIRPEYISIVVPSMFKWFNSLKAEVSLYSYSETWDQAADKPVAIFHTSGTTGTLKPVAWSNRRIGTWCSMLELAREDPSVLVPEVIGKTVFTTFMPAHVNGHNFQLCMPMYLGNTVVLRHPAQTLNTETIEQIMLHGSCTAIILPPGLLAELVKSSRALALLRSLETIVVSGVGLKKECYDLLYRPSLKIQNMYGRSETFPCIQKREVATDPRCVAFHEDIGATFQPHPSGQMELVLQHDDQRQDCLASRTRTRPGIHKTGDLFTRHLTVPDRWIFEGRADDTIDLANGEEIRVSEMEDIIGTHPLVKSALIYGELKTRPLLVIEPWSDVMASLKSGDYKDSYLNDIWPCVEDANATCSNCAQLCRQLTIVMTVPVVRTIQRSIDRRGTVAFITDKIDELYAAYDRSVLDKEAVKPVAKITNRGDEIRRNLRYLQAFREINPLQW